MEKKLILEEISRIYELMDLKIKTSIHEAIGIGGNEVVKFIEKELGQSSDDIIKLLERSTISDAALVSKSFEELLTKSTISNVERKFVSDVLRTMFGSVITKRYSDYMNDLSVEARKKIQGLLLDDTKTLEKKAEKLREYYDSNANEITAQIFVDEAKNTKPNIVPPKPPKPEPIFDINIPNISDQTWNLGKKNGIGTSFYDNLGTKIGGMDPNRAEKLRQEMAEDIHNLNVKDKEENLRAKKEFNELDALDKEIKIRIRKLELEEKQLSIKEKEGKITDAEKLRAIEIKREKAKLLSSRVDLLKKMSFIFIILAVIVGATVVYNNFCSSWFTGLCNFIKGDDNDDDGGEEDDQL